MKKEPTTWAAAAAMIRAELKKHGIKGTVRSRAYAGGTSVDVSLDNALPATAKKVSAFVNQFEYGTFDGMTDSYSYDNPRDDLPQVKYAFVDNVIPADVRASAWEYAKNFFADTVGEHGPHTHEDYIKLNQILNGDYGRWLADRKPRRVA